MKPHGPRTYLRMAMRYLRIRPRLEHSQFNGFTFQHTLDTMPYPEAFIRDVAPREMYDLLMVEKGETAIDAGACIGFYSLQFSRNFNWVRSFEPHPKNVSLLSKNQISNHVQNMAIYNYALGNYDGPGKLYVKDHYRASSSLIKNHLGQPLTKTIPVNVHRLDSLGFSHVDLMKVDVEGMEYQALQGAEGTIRKWHPVLAVEVHQNPQGDPCQCPVCGYIKSLGGGYEITDTRVHTKAMDTHWVLAR